VSSGFKLLDIQTTFLPTVSDIEALLKLKQTRNLAEYNLLTGPTCGKVELNYYNKERKGIIISFSDED